MTRPTSDQVAAFRKLFVARPDAYAVWKDGKPIAIRKPLDAEVIADHLAGDERVGSYLILLDGRTPFLVFDLDAHDKGLVRELLRRLKKWRIPVSVERSKSKGFHVWVFFVKPIRAAVARKFARVLLGDLLSRKIEIFPKQDKVTEGGLGNCIWLPLFATDVAKGKTAFVDEHFSPYRDQWKFLAKIERASGNRILKAMKRLGSQSTDRTSATPKAEEMPAVVLRFPRRKFFPRLAYDASKLPVCGHTILWKGVDELHRNLSLFTLAKQLRNQRLKQDQVEELVLASNGVCRPPLGEKEVLGIVTSVFKTGYTSLGCNDAFIASLCGRHCPIKYPQSKNLTALQILDQANARPVIHPSQAFEQDKLWYGLQLGKKQHIWVNSDREALTRGGMEQTYTLEKMPSKLRWSQPSIKSFLSASSSVNPYELYIQIRKLLTGQIIFRASWQPTVITLWIMGTYVYRIFYYYAYVWITSPGRRTGKSKLLEIVSALGYNATPVMSNPSEAALYRDTSVDGSTQVLDEVESLRTKDQEKQAGFFSILNCGFKKGATVPRFNLETRANENLEVFCPRAIAGISRLHSTLVDRCFKIFLERKSPDKKVARFDERRIGPQLQRMRDSLHIFGLQFASSIAEHYERIESVEVPEQLDDRARDILEPLVAIARVIDEADSKAAMVSQLIKASENIADDRGGDEAEDEATIAALEVLAHHFPLAKEEDWVIRSTKASTIFREDERLRWVQEPRQASSLLRRLGFRSSSHRAGSRVMRGYKVPKHALITLCRNYGLADYAGALEMSKDFDLQTFADAPESGSHEENGKEGVTSVTPAEKG